MTAIAMDLPRDNHEAVSPRLLVAGLLLTVTMVAFEAMAVTTVMPLVARELDGQALYAWAFSAFFLTALIGIVVGGALADLRGPQPVIAVSLALFAAGLLIAGLAPSMPILVLGRVVQGLGSGAIGPVAYAMVGRGVPEEQRPRFFALFSTAWVVPGLVGPGLAAAIAAALDWRAVFLALLPLVVLGSLLTVPAAGRMGPGAGMSASAVLRLGRLAALLAAGAGLLTAGLGVDQPLLALALVSLGGAIAIPTLARLTPPRTLRAGRGLPTAVLLRGIMNFSFFGLNAYIPLALTEWRGMSLAEAGLVLTGSTVSWTIGSWIQARYSRRVPGARLTAIGLAFITLGSAVFGVALAPFLPPLAAIAGWMLAGLGMGIAFGTLSVEVLRLAERGAEGAASSAMSLADSLGTALGAGVAGAVALTITRAGLGGAFPFLGVTAVSVAAVTTGLLLARRMAVPLPAVAAPAG